jgi:hypothetical protein
MTAGSHVNPYDETKPFFACRPVGAEFFATAAYRFVVETDFDVDADRLFAILDDEAAWPVWVSPGIQSVEWTSPRPHGRGTTRTVHMPGGLDVYETFFLWNDGRELAFHFLGTTQKIWDAFAERYEITPQGPGKCHLRWTMAYEPASSLSGIQRLAKPLMSLVLRRYLRKLRAYAHRSVRPQ